MPHTVTEMDNGSCKNMVSNLPLLFAGGYPTSLEKITETQLEKFIPFMVQCSLGYIHIPASDEYSEPEWWPGDLEFIVPFCRPKSFRGNWLEKMRELVVICYSFHKCVFLLRFCTDLASYEPATLRFINNYNSTTSLYQRHTRKLLVTFRNENMLYDQAQQTSGRKCLLPKQLNSQQSDLQNEQMVEPAFFDIYLCDDCDAELYSYDAYAEHEKVCVNRKNVQNESEDDDDDVIFCGSEILPTPKRPDESHNRCAAQNMSTFLMNFSLFHKNNPLALRKIGNNMSSSDKNINIVDGSDEKLRRLPRRTRGIVTLSKCTSIPLSSPCGQFLLKSSKTVMSIDYQMERLERLERFCFAPALVNDGTLITNRPKWLNQIRQNSSVTISYKRGCDEMEHYHSYKFPRRQLSSACKIRNFKFYNKLLIKKCKPCAIQLQRLTAREIENRNIDIRLQHLNITKLCSSKNEQSRTMHVVVDCIDLCSSDEDEAGINIHHNSCIVSIDPTEVERLVASGTQNQLSPGFSTNTGSIRGSSDVHFLHSTNKQNCGPSIFQPLAPSLHLFSSAHNVNPATSPSHVYPSSTNCLLQNSLCMAEETGDNDAILSNMENLTEVKENRVNDWLNENTMSTETITHVPQSHLLIATGVPIIKNNGGISITKPMPSLIKLTKPSSPPSNEFMIRKRAATTVDLS